MQTTLDALLTKLKIPASDQAHIIAKYGNLDPDSWWDEMELIAMSLHTDQPPQGKAPLCEPWRGIWLEMYYNHLSVKESIVKGINNLSPDLQLAIQGLLSLMQQKLSSGYQRLKLGARFTANRAKRLGNPMMKPPDQKFQELLEDILTPVKGVSAGVRLSNAESLLLTWLDDNG